MKSLTQFIKNYGVLFALIVLIIINIATRGADFLQPENLRNLIAQNAYVGIVAIGMTLVIMTAGIDLSVGSMVALCGAVCMLALNKGAEGAPTAAMLMALAASIGAGTLCGLFNGAVIAYARVAPFIVTLAGLAGFRSLALVLGDGGEIRSQVPQFGDFGFEGVIIPGVATRSGGSLTFYWSALIFLLLGVIISFLVARTKFGRYLVAVGANERAAKYSAINTQTVKLWAYTILGALTGLAAFLNAARMNSVGTGSVGMFYELDAIAAVVIGGTSLRGGRGRLGGTVLGVILLTLIANMMTAYRIDPDWQGLVRGAVILVAVLIQRGSRAND